MMYVGAIVKNRSGYDVSFADLPGCISAGDTLDDVLRMGAEALSMHVAGMIEDGDPLPKPSSIDEARAKTLKLLADHGCEETPGTIYVPIHFEVERKEDNEPPMRLAVSMKPNIVRRVDRLARELGLTRSAVLAFAAREYCIRMEETI